MKYCECGCGQTIKEGLSTKRIERRFVQGHNNKNKSWEQTIGKKLSDKYRRKMSDLKKGKTHEELYGKELSKKLKENLSKKLKGKSWIEKYGKEKTNELKNNLRKITSKRFKDKNKSLEHRKKISHFRKGKTYNEIYNKEKSKEIKRKQNISSSRPLAERIGEKRAKEIIKKRIELSRKRQFGKTYEEIYGEKKAKELRQKKREQKKWSKDKIVKAYIEIVNQNGKIKRSDIVKFARKKLICYEQCIVNELGSLDELANLSDIEFKKRNFRGRIGKNERQLLDRLEMENNIKLVRQFPVAGKFIDGYDPINNIAYEIDEKYHKYREVEDFLREKKIKNKINCEFVRVNNDEV